MVTKEQWVDWKHNPVTMRFLGRLNDKREMIKEGLAEGQSENVQVDIGRTQGLKDALSYALVEFDYVEIEENVESGSLSSDSEG